MSSWVRRYKGKLTEGADGVKSMVRTAILGYDYPCVPSGFSCYRFLIPSTKVIDTPLAYLVDRENPTCVLLIGHDRRIVIYPCRDQELLNVVATLPDEVLNEDVHDSWVGSGSLEHMRKSYEKFHPDQKLIMEYSLELR